ncbi:hypothetical protein A4H97_28010 [Niastella yeongjuensis]|uniref:Polyketide cyclase n=1 Tax=Niastella yeongjuensis TaxID=354355 RepID=A0A1V9EUE3_9BACT|nr:hypothetical protein [Niastella yeongjuensis]OQP49739.1 hypothetical protein A4H97_28010 [Niastella yeongjuensis]SEP40724.1 hypothetical protein SAMN05660816_05833 [Niastella yeongjuensis]
MRTVVLFFTRSLGVIAGTIYALVLRLVFNINGEDAPFSLFTVTFIWVTPVVIGIIPLFFASKELLQKSYVFRIGSPILTVTVFFLLCFLTRIEDIICLWIILIPYVVAAAFAGFIAGEIIVKIKDKKSTLYSIVLLPFIVSPIEQQFKTTVENYKVVTKVIIRASPEVIWNNIIRVSQIKESEYTRGFFNYAGIPRPLYAELNKDTLGGTRVGHFEGGLQFVEKVISWDRNRHIGFNISVVPSTIRKTVFDQHILKGNYFKFLQADYNLTVLPDGRTELALSSSYQLNSHLNWYGSYYGNQLLTDFQERLLQVIKNRCDR